MIPLCFSHVATVVSPFRSSMLHFMVKFLKICEIFFSCEKKNNEVEFVTATILLVVHCLMLMGLL